MITSENIANECLILTGVSTCGKSVIADALTKQLSNVVIASRSKNQRQIFQQMLPRKYLPLIEMFGENYLYYARSIYDQDYFLQRALAKVTNRETIISLLQNLNKLYSEHRFMVMQQEEIFAAQFAKQVINENKTIILDNLIFKDDLSAFYSFNIKLVLIYCPFAQFIDNILSRNANAIAKNNPYAFVDPAEIFIKYTKFYSFQAVDKTKAALETLNRAVLIRLIYNRIIPLFGKNLNSAEFVDKMLKAMNLDMLDEVMVLPKKKYDYILNTQSKTIMLAANELISKLGLKSSQNTVALQKVYNNHSFEEKYFFQELKFNNYVNSSLIFLLGTSSAGKSSIVKYIKKQFGPENANLVFTGSDQIEMLLIFFCLQKKYAAEFTYVSQLLPVQLKLLEYIKEPEKFIIEHSNNINIDFEKVINILLKFSKVFSSLLAENWHLYPEICFKIVMPALLAGKIIIIDTIELFSYFRALATVNIHCEIHTVIVYCHLKVLEQHIYSRNESAIMKLDINEIRFFYPFKQLSEIYQATLDLTSCIDKITIDEINQIDINVRAEKLKEIVHSLQEKDAAGIYSTIYKNILEAIDAILTEDAKRNIKQRNKLVENWFCTGRNLIFLKPKATKYDMLFNSGDESADRCAFNIAQIIKNKQTLPRRI